MASLTPGVLSKLFDNAGNRDFKVTGEHRSPLLQVVEILPSLSGGGEEDGDPWRSRGFFLKVSDSLHSTYVSISDEDLELIYSDKIQLGQFVYVSRLDASSSGSSIPVIRGLKPVPKRRPCLGNPTDLLSSDALPIKQSIGFRKPPPKSKPESVISKKDVKAMKLIPDGSATRKCSRADLLVDNGSRKTKTKVDVESRRFSLDSSRRLWDQKQAPKPENGAKSAITPPSTPNRSSPSGGSHKKASAKTVSAVKRPSFSISPLKNKNEIVSLKPSINAAFKDISSPTKPTDLSHLFEIPLSLKTCLDPKISWKLLPSKLSGAGKKFVQKRSLSFLAAVHALEEASAIEGVVYCMCTLAEISESSRKISAAQVVGQFLDLQQRMQESVVIVNSLIEKPSLEAKSSRFENTALWVQAAVRTNLSKIKLFKMQDCNELQNGERSHYVVIETPPWEYEKSKQNKSSSRKNKICSSNSNAKRQLCPHFDHSATNEQPSESRLAEAASLAEQLLEFSREWFRKYLESSLKDGFEFGGEKKGTEYANFVGQLRRVIQWLDGLVGCAADKDDWVEELKNKLCRFLLGHVDFAAVQLNKLSSFQTNSGK